MGLSGYLYRTIGIHAGNCVYKLLAKLKYPKNVIVIMNHHGLSARRCPTPSLPNSASSFCPSRLAQLLEWRLVPFGDVVEPFLWGHPHTFSPSILRNSSSLIILLLCILTMNPNSPSFLPISFCMMFSFSFIRLDKSLFLTFCIHPILSIVRKNTWIAQIGHFYIIILKAVVGYTLYYWAYSHWDSPLLYWLP